MKTSSLFLALLGLFNCITHLSHAQELQATGIYMPLDFQKAYNKKTRLFNGLVSEVYWQNTCKYEIEANIDPYTRTLNGSEKIEYTNNSPDTLKQILLHLHQNVYKKESARGMYDLYGFETNGMQIHSLQINGDTLSNQDYKERFTQCSIKLKEPLPPKSKIELSITWSFQIVNKSTIREGYLDSTSAVVGYWYPKIAVYDDIFGWDNHNYDLVTEFYSPIADYQVNIQMPKGFLIWATGELQNNNNYPPNIVSKLTNALASEKYTSIIDSSMTPYPDNFGMYSWQFIADSVPDFAFFFSDHFCWDMISTKIDNKTIPLNFLHDNIKGDSSVITSIAIRDALKMYSEHDPGISYPYPHFTNVYKKDYGGMEFPMLANDGISGTGSVSANVKIHEMLHSWTPFYLRTNETKFGWLDEGLTEYYTNEIQKKLNLFDEGLTQHYAMYFKGGSTSIENFPLFLSSEVIPMNYMAYNSYLKPNAMILTLRDMIGDESWKRSYAGFIQEWKYKSPTPYDFIFFINHSINQDLNWFWDAWLMHYGYTDIGIGKLDRNKFTVENIGLLPIPFKVIFTDSQNHSQELSFHADCWKNGNTFSVKYPSKDIQKIELKCELAEDLNLDNNLWIRH